MNRDDDRVAVRYCIHCGGEITATSTGYCTEGEVHRNVLLIEACTDCGWVSSVLRAPDVTDDLPDVLELPTDGRINPEKMSRGRRGEIQ